MKVAAEMDTYHVFAILGMACVTLLTRSFFLFANARFRLPAWLERALVFAPIAALSAVIAPEIFMSDHQLIASLWNAKLLASVACVVYYYFKRHRNPSVLRIILIGLGIYLPLHIYFNI
jgi:branched-subunit amino acid transport protein